MTVETVNVVLTQILSIQQDGALAHHAKVHALEMVRRTLPTLFAVHLLEPEEKARLNIKFDEEIRSNQLQLGS